MSTHQGTREEHLAPADTLRGFDRWSASYDQEENPLVAATSWVFDHAPLNCADADVLELGCGTGRNIRRVLSEGARSYTGVDGSNGMLNVAAAHYRDRRVNFAFVDLLAPWAPARMYDLAFLVLVLEHLPTLDALAQTLARAVRPGGRVRIVDLHPERVASGELSHFMEGSTDVRFASVAHSVTSIAQTIEAAGFDVVRRDWLAADSLISAVPSVAKYRGIKLVIDLKAQRRA